MDGVVCKTVLVDVAPPATHDNFGGWLVAVELKFEFCRDEWVIQDNLPLGDRRRHLNVRSRDEAINCMASDVCWSGYVLLKVMALKWT